MKVIVGLGNPGFEYEETRHNIGFKVVDFIAARHRISLNKNKYQSQVGRGNVRGVEVLLVKPQTFMNLSGKAVKAIQKDLDVETGDFIAVFDDIDLALGKIKKKSKGGDAGHRGVRSIMDFLESDSFYRVRVGVGRPPKGMAASDYVLSPFAREEQDLAVDMVACAADITEELLRVD